MIVARLRRCVYRLLASRGWSVDPDECLSRATMGYALALRAGRNTSLKTLAFQAVVDEIRQSSKHVAVGLDLPEQTATQPTGPAGVDAKRFLAGLSPADRRLIVHGASGPRGQRASRLRRKLREIAG